MHAELSTSKLHDIAHMGMRATIGVIFIVHGFGKFGNPGFGGWISSMGIPAEQQLKSNKVPSFNVIGNSPLVLRESLLDEVYKMGENFVDAAKRVVSPGMNGPFCIEGVYDENAKFTSFEFSARIVAGTNIYMDGSPYYSLLFNENMSMGKRIAREIKMAEEKNEIEKIVT